MNWLLTYYPLLVFFGSALVGGLTLALFRRAKVPKTPLEVVIQLLEDPMELWTFSQDNLYLLHPSRLSVVFGNSINIYRNQSILIFWRDVPIAQEKRLKAAVNLAGSRAIQTVNRVRLADLPVNAFGSAEPVSDGALFQQLKQAREAPKPKESEKSIFDHISEDEEV